MSSIEKKAISRSFSFAAKQYDKASYLQKKVADQLLCDLDDLNLSPTTILDAGCGTGYCTKKLASRNPTTSITGVDIAEGMIAQARSNLCELNEKINWVVSDVMSLPFDDNQFDLVFSSLAFQWLDNPVKAYKELKRVLKPGGHLVFSSMGNKTLFELKNSWSFIDQDIHINDFYELKEVKKQVSNASFSSIKMSQDHIVLEYKNMFQLMKNLKAIGASNLNRQRSKGLQGKQKFIHLQKEYDKHRNNKGMLPATYDVIYCSAKNND